MQPASQVKPMVEAGILSGIAIIFALMSVYLPVVGAFIHLIWPVPIILLGVRHGVRRSVLATIVAGILIAIILHPLHAVSVVVGFGLTAIVLGHGIRNEFPPTKILIRGSAASIVCTVMMLLISMLVIGTNPLALQQDIVAQSMEQSIAFYRQMGMSTADLENMSSMMSTMGELMKIILPSAFALAAVVTAYINLMVARRILKKMGHYVAPFPAFKDWQMPRLSLYGFIVGILAMYWGHTREWTILYQAGVNIQMITTLFLVLQGLALFYFMADKYNFPRWARILMVVMILTNGIMLQAALFAGAFDMAINYRVRNGSGSA